MLDRDTKLRAVAAHFQLMGWEPGKMCTGCLDPNGHAFTGEDEDGLPVITSHEIPPPDPRDPAVRVALEEALLKVGAHSITFDYGGDGRVSVTLMFYAEAKLPTIEGIWEDTPADALLEATYQVVTATRSDG